MFLFLLGLSCLTVQSQKVKIQGESYKQWTSVEDGMLSNNGDFVLFRIKNQPIDGNTIVVKDLNTKWEYRSIHFHNVNFSDDSKFMFAMSNDTLVKLDLQRKTFSYTPNVNNYEIYSKQGNNWLIYSVDDRRNQFIIKSLKNNKELEIKNVKDYNLSPSGNEIVCRIQTDSTNESLQWTNLTTYRSNIFYVGAEVKKLVFDKKGQSIAFITQAEQKNEIWYYKSGMNYSQLIINDTLQAIREKGLMTLDADLKFSKNSKKIFFYLSQNECGSDVKVSSPEIWSYEDSRLLPQLRIEGKVSNPQKKKDLMIFDLETNQIQSLLTHGENIISSSLETSHDDILVAQLVTGNPEDLIWNPKINLSYYVCFTKTGILRPLKERCKAELAPIEISPSEDYVVYFDSEQSHYFSYEIKTGVSRNISASLDTELYFSYNYNEFDRPFKNGTRGIIDWVRGKHKVIVQGSFDIWELDLKGALPPRNLTSTVSNMQVVYSRAQSGSARDGTSNNWMVFGFDLKTKRSSLHDLNLEDGKLNHLFSTNYFLGSPYESDFQSYFLKPKYQGNILLRLGNTANSPNYFITKDYVNFYAVSNNYPEKKFYWLKSELINYKDHLVHHYQGILYTPEDLDSNKRYPVIINYYLESSNTLNEYLDIKPSNVGINIPLLVSHGYLVFLPDINLRNMAPGQSALESVVGAADLLATFRFVNPSKIGITGHSHGGFETNYIIAHTNRFAAAVSGAGISSLIDYYNSYHLEIGRSNHDFVKSAFQMIQGIEAIPRKYVENTPILNAIDVRTPLLLMHNNKDAAVSVDQSIRLFIELRSLLKPVWLIQYPDEGHQLIDLNNKLDYQEKIIQFFDHYLKDITKPKWMINHN